MKDYVFIGWSRNRELAIALKKILDKRGFVCVVGGIYEDNPEYVRVRKGTVNETINFQMAHCDQSILLFQKIDDNLAISGNLIYELGFINAQYSFIESATKLHIFKIDITQADDNLFPSDLHGVWGTNIISDGKNLNQIAQEIACEFLNNQNQIKRGDKFKLLNNHYYVEYEMKKHFDNPTMSDYDLAINILVYVQAAFCYQEQNDIKAKIEHFKIKMIENDICSNELNWVVDYAILTLTLFCITIPDEDNGQLCMKGSVFRKLLAEYEDLGERIGDQFPELGTLKLHEMKLSDEFIINDFESCLIAQMQEHTTYLILVYLCNNNLDKSEIEKYASLGIKYCLVAMENLELLAKRESDKMYAKLLLCYAYKNLSTFYSSTDDQENWRKNQIISYRLRKELNSYVRGISTIKPSLKDYITLEYLLQVVEEAKLCQDDYKKSDFILEIREYIEERNKNERNRNFMFNMLINEFSAIDN